MAGRNCTILVIDDDAGVREILRRHLAAAGYAVTVAENGAAAMQMVHTDVVPDVIVLDLMMPTMSGFEVLAAMRVHPQWRSIPVVVVTATMGYSAEHLDAAAVLTKPFDVNTVKAAIEKALAAR